MAFVRFSVRLKNTGLILILVQDATARPITAQNVTTFLVFALNAKVIDRFSTIGNQTVRTIIRRYADAQEDITINPQIFSNVCSAVVL
jgi:hypothetical protein